MGRLLSNDCLDMRLICRLHDVWFELKWMQVKAVCVWRRKIGNWTWRWNSRTIQGRLGMRFELRLERRMCKYIRSRFSLCWQTRRLFSSHQRLVDMESKIQTCSQEWWWGYNVLPWWGGTNCLILVKNWRSIRNQRWYIRRKTKRIRCYWEEDQNYRRWGLDLDLQVLVRRGLERSLWAAYLI